jgi:hypothetical protein
MTTRAEAAGLGARAELRAWYFGHLRPRLVEAAAAGVVEPGAVAELDLQVAGLFGEALARTNSRPQRLEIPGLG